MSYYQQAYTPVNGLDKILEDQRIAAAQAKEDAKAARGKEFNLGNALIKGLSAWAMTGFTNPVAGLLAGATASTGDGDVMGSITGGVASGLMAGNLAGTTGSGNPLDTIGNLIGGKSTNPVGDVGNLVGMVNPQAGNAINTANNVMGSLGNLGGMGGQTPAGTPTSMPVATQQPAAQLAPIPYQARQANTQGMQANAQSLSPLQQQQQTALAPVAPPNKIVSPVKMSEGDTEQVKYLKTKINMLTKQTSPEGLDIVKKDIDTNSHLFLQKDPQNTKPLLNDAEAIYQALKVKLAPTNEQGGDSLASVGKVAPQGQENINPVQPVQTEGNLLDNITNAVGQVGKVGGDVLGAVGNSLYKGTGDLLGGMNDPSKQLKLAQYLQTLQKPETTLSAYENMAKNNVESQRLKAEDTSYKKMANQTLRMFLSENKGLTPEQQSQVKILQETLNSPNIQGKMMYEQTKTMLDAIKKSPTIDSQRAIANKKDAQLLVSEMNSFKTVDELNNFLNSNKGKLKEMDDTSLGIYNKAANEKSKQLQNLEMNQLKEKVKIELKKLGKTGGNNSSTKREPLTSNYDSLKALVINNSKDVKTLTQLAKKISNATDLNSREKAQLLTDINSLANKKQAPDMQLENP